MCSALAQRPSVAELELHYLDAFADIFFNGDFIGNHKSAHYPFVYDIKPLLRPGKNQIAVRMTTGLEEINDFDLAGINLVRISNHPSHADNRYDMRRACVRKPQYTVGWDWGPKAITCGMNGDVVLSSYRRNAIRSVSAKTTAINKDGSALLSFEAEIEQLHAFKTRDARISLRVLLNDELCAEKNINDYLLTSGLNCPTMSPPQDRRCP